MNRIIRHLISSANLTESGKLIAQKIRKLCRIFLRRESGSSLSVFSHLARNVSGQIATLLTLVIVVMLIMVLVIVNIGDISLKATAVANAADAGVLQLASSLSTTAGTMSDGLGGGIKFCKKGGLLAVVLAAILAIAAVAVAILSFGVGTPLALMAIGALAGAIGGFVGGHIMGLNASGVWAMTLMGANIGMAIGSGASIFVNPAGPAAAAEGVAGAGEVAKEMSTLAKVWKAISSGYNATLGKLVKLGDGLISWIKLEIIQPAASFVKTIPVIGKIGTVLSKFFGANILTGSKEAITLGEAMSMMAFGGDAINAQAQEQRSSISSANKMAAALNRLPERDTFREGAFLAAFSKIVTDPRTTIDINDSNNNGNTDEEIPYFQFWWDVRTNLIEEVKTDAAAIIAPLIQSFFGNELNGLKNDANSICIPSLSRVDIEGSNGEITELCSVLEDHGYEVSFWELGPTQAEMDYWSECIEEDPGWPDCDEDYLIDRGYDGLDLAIDEYADRIVVAETQDDETWNTLAATAFTSTPSWLEWYYQDPEAPGYDPEFDVSFPYIFGKIRDGNSEMGFQGMNEWIQRLEIIKNSLPDCQYDPVTFAITNAPCKSPPGVSPAYYTIDTNPDDDFQPVYNRIAQIIGIAEDFSAESEDFGSNLKSVYDANLGPLDQLAGGLNPATYDWTDKQGGVHKVTVETKYFPIPEITKRKSGNWLCKKTCWHLNNYSDNGSRTQIKIIREDPSERAVGILGFWKTGKIEKSASASWSYNSRPELTNMPW